MIHLKYIGSTDCLKLMGFKEIVDKHYRFRKKEKYNYTSLEIIDREIFIYQSAGYVDDEVLVLLFDMIQKGLIIKVDEKGNRI